MGVLTAGVAVRKKWGEAVFLLTKVLRQSDSDLLERAQGLIKSAQEKFSHEEERCQGTLEGLISHS